jgi:Zn-dependent protease with chaperone function
MVRLVNTNGSLAAPNKRARYFSTHPTLMERLAHADEFAARHRVSQTTGADK